MSVGRNSSNEEMCLESGKDLFSLWREWDRGENGGAGRRGSNLGKDQALRSEQTVRKPQRRQCRKDFKKMSAV